MGNCGSAVAGEPLPADCDTEQQAHDEADYPE